MNNTEKLVNKFFSRKNSTVEDCHKLLVSYGYEYHKKGTKSVTIVIPKSSKYITSLYINQLIKDLGLEQ